MKVANKKRIDEIGEKILTHGIEYAKSKDEYKNILANTVLELKREEVEEGFCREGRFYLTDKEQRDIVEKDVMPGQVKECIDELMNEVNSFIVKENKKVFFINAVEENDEFGISLLYHKKSEGIKFELEIGRVFMRTVYSIWLSCVIVEVI